MQDYQCEWRFSLQAESPEAAAKAAAREFAHTVNADRYHVMTVITEHGEEIPVAMEGLLLAGKDAEPFEPLPAPRPVVGMALSAISAALALLGGSMIWHWAHRISH